MILDWSFYVATAVGESLLIKYMYKSCEISMVDRKIVMNLIVLDLLEFDFRYRLATYLPCHFRLSFEDN